MHLRVGRPTVGSMRAENGNRSIEHTDRHYSHVIASYFEQEEREDSKTQNVAVSSSQPVRNGQ
jgi:hypothetical protein